MIKTVTITNPATILKTSQSTLFTVKSGEKVAIEYPDGAIRHHAVFYVNDDTMALDIGPQGLKLHNSESFAYYLYKNRLIIRKMTVFKDAMNAFLDYSNASPSDKNLCRKYIYGECDDTDIEPLEEIIEQFSSVPQQVGTAYLFDNNFKNFILETACSYSISLNPKPVRRRLYPDITDNYFKIIGEIKVFSNTSYSRFDLIEIPNRYDMNGENETCIILRSLKSAKDIYPCTSDYEKLIYDLRNKDKQTKRRLPADTDTSGNAGSEFEGERMPFDTGVSSGF